MIAILAAPVSAGLRVGGARIDVALAPGVSATYPMNVGNTTNEPMDIAIEVKGFGNYINGPVRALDVEDDLSPYTAREYVAVSPSSFHLEPGESRDVTVTVNMPGDVGDGGRYAIVFIHTIPGEGGFAISTAVATQMLLTIEGSNLITTGDTTSLELGEIESEQLFYITATTQNTGNYHYKLSCNGTITNNLGQVVGQSWQTDSIYTLVPTSSQQIQVPFEIYQDLPPGVYNADIDVYTSDETLLDSGTIQFVLTETYKPMPLRTLAVEFWDTGKSPDLEWDMADDGTLMENVDASSLTSLVTIVIPQGGRVLKSDGEPPDTIVVTLLDPPPSPPVDYTVISAFDFKPDGTILDPKADITVAYPPGEVPEGLSETQLCIATLDEDTFQWSFLDSELDTDANTISFTVEHFTIYAVLAPPAPEPTTILGIEKQTWIWIGIGVLWVIVLTLFISVLKRRGKKKEKKPAKRPRTPQRTGKTRKPGDSRRATRRPKRSIDDY